MYVIYDQFIHLCPVSRLAIMLKFTTTTIILSITLFNSVFGVFRKSKESVLAKSVDEEQQQRQQQQAPPQQQQRVENRVPPGLLAAAGGAGAPPEFGGPPPNFDGVPPDFENVLPKEVLKQMRELYRNPNIPIHKKQLEFDRLMSSVPAEILAKLPLPPGFETLPDKFQTEIRTIHADPKLNWTEKAQKVHKFIQSLPDEHQPRPPVGFPPLPPPGEPLGDFFPPNPPPGFEKVIPPKIYKELLQIHRNPKLSPEEKGNRIDQIMRALPQDIIDKLPLPPGFDRLPENYLKKAKAIFHDRKLSFKQKDQKVAEFVSELPPNLRRLVHPPLPPVFDRLSPETKDKISDLFDDDSLDEQQRQKHFWGLINVLPEAERAAVQEALKLPA